MKRSAMTRDMQVLRQPLMGRRSSLVQTSWQWLISISQVAVEQHYATPWERASDRRQLIKKRARW